MSRRPQPGPWFGNLLPWRSYGRGWPPAQTTSYCGRTYEIRKVGLAEAERCQTRPGWHLLRQPDDHNGTPGQLGGALARTLTWAHRMAEVHIITGEPVYSLTPVPSLYLAVGSSAVWDTDTGPVSCVPDHQAALINVHRQTAGESGAGGEHLAVIVPKFGIPDDVGSAPITVAWHLTVALRLQPPDLSGGCAPGGVFESWPGAFAALTGVMTRA